MFRAFHGTGAVYLRKQVHHYVPTRALRSFGQALKRIPSFTRSRAGGRSFQVLAARLWNSLPLHLKMVQDLLTFRRQLKTWHF